MSDDLSASTERLALARAQDDPASLADALLRHANALAAAGRLDAATQSVDEAAAVHAARGARDHERRCQLIAAELLRLQGRRDEAKQRLRMAGDGADPRSPDAAALHAEAGEMALGDGDAVAADEAFSRALDALPPGAPAWWRGRARARAALGRFETAADDLDRARERCEALGDLASARRAGVEAATAWQQARRFDRARQMADRTRHQAREAGDHGTMGALALLDLAHALERGDTAAARTQALAAREHALQGNAPDTYLGAALALSRLADRAGDHAQAYGMLATGWATLSDLLGPELARRAVEPALLELRRHWGAERFDAARHAYEAERRAARRAGDLP